MVANESREIHCGMPSHSQRLETCTAGLNKYIVQILGGNGRGHTGDGEGVKMKKGMTEGDGDSRESL